jgi:hypothetical protein
MPLGGAEIEYKVDGQPTAWTNVTVVPANFEFYRIGMGGPVIAHSVALNGSLTPVGLATPAQPGQTIRLTGTGIGVGTDFHVTVGGVTATVARGEPRRSQSGLDEILIQIPAAAPDGCYVPLVLTYNSTSITSAISKTSNGAPCMHPFQLSTTDMQTLDNGGWLAAAVIDMSTSLQVATPEAVSRNETADGYVTEMSAADIASYFQPQPAGPSCTVSETLAVFGFEAGSFPGILSGTPVPIVPPQPPDPGVMSLQNGANTLTVDPMDSYFGPIPPPTEGPLASPPAPVIAGGSWMWRSAGSADLAASSFTFALPPPIQLNGAVPLFVLPGFNQTLRWNGAAFDEGAMVSASLSGTYVSVNCTVPANSGVLTIPADLLAQVAPGSIGTLSINVAETGSYIPHTQLKTLDGRTLLLFVNYSAGETLPADIQ